MYHEKLLLSLVAHFPFSPPPQKKQHLTVSFTVTYTHIHILHQDLMSSLDYLHYTTLGVSVTSRYIYQ